MDLAEAARHMAYPEHLILFGLIEQAIVGVCPFMFGGIDKYEDEVMCVFNVPTVSQTEYTGYEKSFS